MRQRAVSVDVTRRRITEAAVRLHTSVGPSATSFAAVADEAGVTRLTLYRHFSSKEELFAACMTHWRAAHPAPDAERGGRIRSFERRLRTAIDEMYRWYAANAADLYPIYRDVAFTPDATQRARRANVEHMVAALLGGVAPSAELRAALGHVLGYGTWRSLTVDEASSHEAAVDLAARFVLAARRARRRRVHDVQ
jgi:AcrR family transcriptional regulator